MSNSIIEESIPKDNDKVRITDKVKKEMELNSQCVQCGPSRVIVTLVVNRCRLNVSKYKQKYEKFLKVDYYGPFTLFSKLRKFHENELKSGNPKHPVRRRTGYLNEIGFNNSKYRLLQLDVKDMFMVHKELYWNLIYRFIKDHKDYSFILPYEVDLEISEAEESKSSPSSEDDLFSSNNKKMSNLNNTTTTKFSGMSMTASPEKPHRKNHQIGIHGINTDRRVSAFVEVNSQFESLKPFKKTVKLRPKESRKSF
jgi:hypothetical protein